MKKESKSVPRTAQARHTNAGIEVEGGYVPEHADTTKGKVELEGEDPAAADPIVAKALAKGKPKVPETTDAEALADEALLPIGIQTGQMSRGSYSTDQSTGGGGYHDHRSGQFGVAPVAQPGNDEDVEPDPVPKGF